MPGISQYQSVFRVSKNAFGDSPEQSRVNKRNRKQVSCLACRTRKAKCNRQVPCMQCLKRGDGPTCTYQNAPRAELDDNPRSSEAQLRLRKLEEMVNSLMANKAGSQSCEGANPNPSANKIPDSTPLETSLEGHLNTSGAESNYLGATHWQAILQNIRDIQIVLETAPEESQEISTSHVPKPPDILIDTTDPLTLMDVYKYLPPRQVADKLLYIYFNSKHIQMPVVHTVKFSREYEAFWAQPASASYLWISMLFSILHIGSQIHNLSASNIDPCPLEGPTSEDYHIMSGRALVAGQYHKARPYSVEAAVLYAVGKICRQEDRDMEAWMIMGVSTRLAVRMGYHRDPSHLKNISPFEGEMRRRIFYVVEALDLLLSFQVGLPPIIHEEDCDTGPPTNLFDADFDQDCKSLPPARATTDATPMLYGLCKRQMVKFLRRVSRHVLSFKTPSYDETMKLDRELHDIHTNLPLSVRVKPLCSYFQESTQTVMIRLNLELMYLRSICVLHRGYLSHDKSNPAYSYSRRICTDSALQTLRYEAELHMACQPGGRFYNERWISSSLILYDFLLSAMIICLDLYESCNKTTTISREELEIKTRKYDALKQSQVIWESRKGVSKDARHALRVLEFMLSKVQRPNIPSALPTQCQMMLDRQHCTTNGGEDLTTSNTPSYNATQSGSHSQSFSGVNFVTDPNFDDSLNAIFCESDPIDWELVDQFLFDRGSKTDALVDWQLPDTLLNK